MSLASPSPLSVSSVTARRILIVGGVRSGKSGIAEALVSAALNSGATTARYVATARGNPDDPSWDARVATHRARRPAAWQTVEVGTTPDQLATVLSSADATEVLLVDDLGGWLTASFEAAGRWDDPGIALEWATQLAKAVAACCAARLVLVSPEVGLSVVPANEAGRTFADAQGTTNRLVAQACEQVGLVVAGRLLWLPAAETGTLPETAICETAICETAAVEPATTEAATTEPAITELATTEPATTEPAAAEIPVAVPAPVALAEPEPPAAPEPWAGPANNLPVPQFVVSDPDEDSANLAEQRLLTLDAAGAGLGNLKTVVRFAAATQGRPDPQPWNQIRMLLLHGDYLGGVSAGDSRAEARLRMEQATSGQGLLGLLAAQAGVRVQAADCPQSAAIESSPALDPEVVEAAISHGVQLANQAVDEGVDLLVLGSCGAGAQVVATAVTQLYAGGELVRMLPRVLRADDTADDPAWMRRCLALRDALFRARDLPRDGRSMLSNVGGGQLAVAAGILVGAAMRRTPVLIDGPMAAASTLIARDLAAVTPRWVLLPDVGGHPTTRMCATVLCLDQFLDLRMDLGDGCTALTALGVVQTALRIAGSTGTGSPDFADPDVANSDVADPNGADPNVANPVVDSTDVDSSGLDEIAAGPHEIVEETAEQ